MTPASGYICYDGFGSGQCAFHIVRVGVLVPAYRRQVISVDVELSNNNHTQRWLQQIEYEVRLFRGTNLEVRGTRCKGKKTLRPEFRSYLVTRTSFLR